MAASFVVGDCFVAEALDELSGRRADRKGRFCVACSYGLLCLQLYLYPFQVRSCAILTGSGCDVFDGIFWIAWMGTVVLYTACLLGSPHGGGLGDKCRRCGPVAGRDHHCIIINGCVGSRNYTRFVALLLCAFTSATNILVSAYSWVLEVGTAVHVAAYLACAVYAIGALLLLLFQVHLSINHQTTIEFLRASK